MVGRQIWWMEISRKNVSLRHRPLALFIDPWIVCSWRYVADYVSTASHSLIIIIIIIHRLYFDLPPWCLIIHPLPYYRVPILDGKRSESASVALAPDGTCKVNFGDNKWTFKRVILTAEKQIRWHSKNCCNNAEVSWASKLNPEENWDICEECQVNKFGG